MIEIRKPDTTLMSILPPVDLCPDITYIPSQYALQFEHNGKQYAFNNLTKQCIEGELPKEARAGEGYDDLITAQFLVPDDRDECAYYNSISALFRIFRRRKGEHGYIILPTLACNARCTYCYEAGMETVTMKPDTVEQTIRYIISSHAEKEVHIVWFGGEPLLGEKIIDRISEGLMEAGVPFKSVMISNGSLITPAIIEKMTGLWHLYRIQITMDGNESDYITRKCYYKEDDQYHLVMRAIDRMSEKGIRVQVRCNVDEQNWDGLPALLRDMNAYIHHRENVYVYLAPLYQIRESERAMSFWEKVSAAYPMIESAGFQVKRMMGVGSTFRVNTCIADSGGVVICPDGVLSPCEHLQQKAGFGDVWHGVMDESRRHEFCRVDRIREKCRSCPYLPDCTGFAGCPIHDSHCRELHELMAIDSLKRMVEHEEVGITDGDDFIC